MPWVRREAMSISSISGGAARFDQPEDKNEERKVDDRPKERSFDFAGPVYAAVTLPHGLLPASRPTVGTIAKDASDFQGKLERVARDLSSPGMRERLSKHVEASKTGLKIGVKLV